MLFVNVSDFFTYFPKFFVKKLVYLQNSSYLCIAIKKQRVSISKIIQIHDLRVL